MTETERILRAMAAMDEFTVADLVLACDARAATVRTVLQRHKADLEALPGARETGRPGGRWKRYRMRPQAVSALVDDAEVESIEASGVPSGLLAAEELLLSARTATAESSTLASLLRRARRFRDDAVGAKLLRTPVAVAHQQVVDALIMLTEGEMAQDRAALAEARRRLEHSKGELSHADDGLIEAVERRLADSPLIDQSHYGYMDSELSAQKSQQREGIGRFLLGEVLDLVSKFVDTTPKQASQVFAYDPEDLSYGRRGYVVHDPEDLSYGRRGYVVHDPEDLSYGRRAYVVHDPEDLSYGRGGYVVVHAKKGFGTSQKRLRPTGQSLAAEARKRMAYTKIFDEGFGVSNRRPTRSAERQVSPPSEIGP